MNSQEQKEAVKIFSALAALAYFAALYEFIFRFGNGRAGITAAILANLRSSVGENFITIVFISLGSFFLYLAYSTWRR